MLLKCSSTKSRGVFPPELSLDLWNLLHNILGCVLHTGGLIKLIGPGRKLGLLGHLGHLGPDRPSFLSPSFRISPSSNSKTQTSRTKWSDFSFLQLIEFLLCSRRKLGHVGTRKHGLLGRNVPTFWVSKAENFARAGCHKHVKREYFVGSDYVDQKGIFLEIVMF